MPRLPKDLLAWPCDVLRWVGPALGMETGRGAGPAIAIGQKGRDARVGRPPVAFKNAPTVPVAWQAFPQVRTADSANG
jgi:hypothetical protein